MSSFYEMKYVKTYEFYAMKKYKNKLNYLKEW